MHTIMAGLTVVAASLLFGLSPAGAQVEGCPESPQLCPPQVEEQPPIVREEPPNVDVDEPEVLGEGQQRPQPRPRNEVAAANQNRGLPVTGADTMALVAAGGVLVAAGGGLVARSKRANAGAR